MSRTPPSCLPFALLLLLGTSPAWAQDTWSGRLQGGGTVEVDPETNRPTLRRGGVETQLWDGIHHLEGGQELRVESGRVIPNEEILDARDPYHAAPEAKEQRTPPGQPAPCERLVTEVCGADGACEGASACVPARQLLDMEREEQRAAGQPGSWTFTSGKCREARADDFFAPCAGEAPAARTSPSP